MKRKFLSVSVTLIMIAFFLSLSTCNSYSSGGYSSSSGVSGSGNYISISGFAFNPSSLNVSNGTTVYWTNNDSTTHTVTSTSGVQSFNVSLAPGTGTSILFTNMGLTSYHCSIHTSMLGSVTVTN